MRPWRPSQVLHIGLADSAVHSIPASSTFVRPSKTEGDTSSKHVYIQWCQLPANYDSDPNNWYHVDFEGKVINPTVQKQVPHTEHDKEASLPTSIKSQHTHTTATERRLKIAAEMAFSSACETLYVGTLFGY